MNIPAIWKRATKAVADNAPTILTAIGATGAITTAVLAAKGSFKAAEIIRDAQRDYDRTDTDGEVVFEEIEKSLDFKEKIKLVWPQYVPAITTGAVSVACIISANHISTRRATALASAYTMSQQLFKDYKDKVVERLGEKKEQEVRDAITKDTVAKNPPPPIVVTGGNKVCQVHDEYTGRWFTSTYEALKKAEIDINFQILNDGFATLGDFWRMLGVSHANIADEIGWNTDKKFELAIGSTIDEDTGIPALTLDFRTVPVRGYGSY